MYRKSDGQRDHGERGICLAGGRKHGRTRYEQVPHAVNAAVGIDDARTSIRAHSRSANMVSTIGPIAGHLHLDGMRIVVDRRSAALSQIIREQRDRAADGIDVTGCVVPIDRQPRHPERIEMEGNFRSASLRLRSICQAKRAASTDPRATLRACASHEPTPVGPESANRIRYSYGIKNRERYRSDNTAFRCLGSVMRG